MTYIDYLNRFNCWLETNALPAHSQLMYFKLLNVFNRAGWPKDVGVDNRRMEMMLDGAAKSTVIRARDRLISAGFIAYQKGKKGLPNRYILKDISKIVFTGDTENATDSATENATDSATFSATENATHIKTKTKKKNNTPYHPPGEFDAFWSEYPRKAGKGAAEKAWKKISPDAETVRLILSALEAQKGCEQWQRENGQYIPYPATWLNQRRWEDEPDVSAPQRRILT